METAELEKLLNVFKALAHESRLKILGLLAEQEYSVSELARMLDLRDPTVSHHLSKLEELGLVTMRQEGTTHYYRLDVKTLQALNRELLTPEKVAALAEEEDSDAWEQRVLRTYLDGEQLKKIPESYKKRLVILRWLVDRFEYDTRYPEKQVNEIIKRHHEDSATLRRELIINRFMERDHGIYWRLPREVTEEQIAAFMSSSGPTGY